MSKEPDTFEALFAMQEAFKNLKPRSEREQLAPDSPVRDDLSAFGDMLSEEVQEYGEIIPASELLGVADLGGIKERLGKSPFLSSLMPSEAELMTIHTSSPIRAFRKGQLNKEGNLYSTAIFMLVAEHRLSLLLDIPCPLSEETRKWPVNDFYHGYWKRLMGYTAHRINNEIEAIGADVDSN